jgi:PAS domain S-box-containing protein
MPGAWQFTPYAAPLIVGAGVLMGVAYLAWRRRNVRAGLAMSLLAITTGIYTFGYAMELCSLTLPGVQFWLKVEYIGAATQTVLLLIMIAYYTGRQTFLKPLNMMALFIIPAMTILLAWTNDLHGLIWQDLHLVAFGNLSLADFTRGGWYWVNVGYNGLMILSSMVLLARGRTVFVGLLRVQFRLFLLGIAIPIIGYAIYLLGGLPIPLDLNPYTLTLTSLIFAIAVLNYQMLNIMPVARAAVLSSMIDAVIVLDAQWRVVDINLAARQMLGLDPERTIGRPAAAVLAHWPALMGQVSGPAAEAHAEVTLESRGEIRHYDLHNSPLYSASGRREGRLIVLRDITDRVRTETALLETNRLLSTLHVVDGELTRKLEVGYVIDIALGAAMSISRADVGYVALVEEQGVRVQQGMGACPPNIVGRLLPMAGSITARVLANRQSEMILDVSQDPEYFALDTAMVAQISVPLLSGEKLIGVLTLETADPEYFNGELYNTIRMLAGRAAVAIDNANMYEERQTLIDDLDSFARTVAHDLKGPLGVIRGYTELLDGNLDDLPPEERQECVLEIRRAADKSGAIIEGLLLLAGVRLAAGVEFGPVDMAHVVKEAVNRVDDRLILTDPEIVLPDDWPQAWGYGSWIEEIWTNYISNAIKYGGQPARVELGWDRRPDGQLRFWVQDNGAGLSPEDQARLFRPFIRLKPSQADGHGLGLSIVRRITERLGGQTGVESQPGAGSRFYFTLPAAPDASSLVPRAEPPRQIPA